MAVNVKGLFHCVKAVYPAMKQQGKGKIINISSGTALSGSPFFLHYVSSKAGVIGFTRALAREVGGDNICVNSIMPGSDHFRRESGRRHDRRAIGRPKKASLDSARSIPSGSGRHGHFSRLGRQRLHDRPVDQRRWRHEYALNAIRRQRTSGSWRQDDRQAGAPSSSSQSKTMLVKVTAEPVSGVKAWLYFNRCPLPSLSR